MGSLRLQEKIKIPERFKCFMLNRKQVPNNPVKLKKKNSIGSNLKRNHENHNIKRLQNQLKIERKKSSRYKRQASLAMFGINIRKNATGASPKLMESVSQLYKDSFLAPVIVKKRHKENSEGKIHETKTTSGQKLKEPSFTFTQVEIPPWNNPDNVFLKASSSTEDNNTNSITQSQTPSSS